MSDLDSHLAWQRAVRMDETLLGYEDWLETADAPDAEPSDEYETNSEVVFCCYCGLPTTQREGTRTSLGLAHVECAASNREEPTDEA